MTIYQLNPLLAPSGLRYQFGKDLPALANGDEIDFANGCYHPGVGSWGYAPSSANFTGLDNFTLANYGTGMAAVLDPRLFEAPGTTAGWEIRRTTGTMKIWRKLLITTASAAVDRVWLGATSSGYAEGQRTNGTAYARLSNNAGELYHTLDAWTIAGTTPGVDDEEAALDMLEASPFYWTSLKASGGATTDRVIYMKVLGTGSDYPPAVYGGFAFIQRGTGTTLDSATPAGIIIRDGTNYLIDGLTVGGDRAIDGTGPTTKTSSAIIRNVTASYFDKRGIAFNTGATFGWSSILVEDFVINSVTNEEEQDPTSTTNSYLHGSEGVEISTNNAGTIDAVTVQHGLCYGIGHGGVTVTQASGVISNAVVRFNDVRSESWELDVRHYQHQGTTGGGSKFYGNVSNGACSKSEFSGIVEVYGSYFLNFRDDALDSSARYVMRLGPLASGVGDDMYVHHNWILGAEVTPFQLSASVPLGDNDLRLTHNLIGMAAGAGELVFKTSGTNGNLSDVQTIEFNHVEMETGTPQVQWKGTTDEAWTVGPAAVTGWANNTHDTRLSEIPTSLYPPSMAAEIFG